MVHPIDAPLLLNRYQPQVLIARGSTASVYRGIDVTLGRHIAIKIFTAGANLKRYREELRLLASLSHHGVVSIVDAGIDLTMPSEPHPFLVMELVRGRTIDETLRRGSLPRRQIGEIGYEVAEALDYVHSQGVIHRDITPSNVMLTNYGTATSRSRARLTDFGIALDVAYIPEAGATILGTAAYLSPEQVRNRSLEPSTDIYSLGLVMLECFTLTIAFPGEAIKSAMARINTDPVIPLSVPAEWRGLIAQMTQQEPGARPTAAEVAFTVRDILRRFPEAA
ncbi:MAG: serine/threonine protein kinase [Glaciihabitans sp.]|nr:serine/threonine protein kinase [Glaciihabitans sp.]